MLFVARAATSPAISSVIAAATVNGAAPNFIEIDQADGIAKRNPTFESIDIDAGTFGGTPPMPDDSLKTLSFAQYLVARKSDSDSVIATLAKTIYSSRQALAAAVPGRSRSRRPRLTRMPTRSCIQARSLILNDRSTSIVLRQIWRHNLLRHADLSGIRLVAGRDGGSYLRRDNRTRRLRLSSARSGSRAQGACGARDLEALEQLQVRSGHSCHRDRASGANARVRRDGADVVRLCARSSFASPSPGGARRFSTIREPRPRQRPPLPPRYRPNSTVN